jgi:hypothetical protein
MLHADPPQSLMTEIDQTSQHDNKRLLSSVVASTSRVAMEKVHFYSSFSQTKNLSSTNWKDVCNTVMCDSYPTWLNIAL